MNSLHDFFNYAEEFISVELLEQIMLSVIVIIVAIISVRSIKPVIRQLDDKIDAVDLSKHSYKLFTKAIGYLIYGIAIVIILSIFGLSEALYMFLTGGAILGFAIGYASKDIVSNTLSGIIIAVDRPFRIGDDVELVGIRGIVNEIALRTTKIKTGDGVMVEIPNSLIISKPVKNFSKKG
ncbi:MAG: hypothetical protein DRO94_04895 [Candidatus Altiarchaeales archaeon]|nr:MAG: hypothetical protein DRO95_04040 [Candidatus Altiarchaeales archaeon]RLI93580.1 MAG: hypothetical protein DRO94_04895 [Candidatus Altiarchaeales archaeon]HDO82444.1 mechanosensitive ion channel [Candidatus Altiarchaeales archaeon]HEX55093.1 mechanosensitive ion channel [Candidatus Altiarchaeales archaeon]